MTLQSVATANIRNSTSDSAQRGSTHGDTDKPNKVEYPPVVGSTPIVYPPVVEDVPTLGEVTMHDDEDKDPIDYTKNTTVDFN